MIDADGEWDRFAAVCKEFGISPAQALLEKQNELRARLFLLCLPRDHISESQYPEYVRLALRHEPPDELISRMVRQQRGRRLSEDEKVDIELRQHDRCAVCGKYLNQASRPHVDHIIPIALGGSDNLNNMQLLCAQCNMGKGDLLIWLLGIPFQHDGMSSRLRYCVLARAVGRCQVPGCDSTVRNAELQPMPVISIGLGGRWIYDNLRAVCSDHASEQVRRTKHEALTALRRSRLMRTRRYVTGQ